MQIVPALVIAFPLIIGCGVPDPLPGTTSAAPCPSTSDATTQQQTTTSGELTSGSGAPTTTGSTGDTSNTSSGCPYENMVCELFELGAVCLWPHR